MKLKPTLKVLKNQVWEIERLRTFQLQLRREKKNRLLIGKSFRNSSTPLPSILSCINKKGRPTSKIQLFKFPPRHKTEIMKPTKEITMNAFIGYRGDLKIPAKFSKLNDFSLSKKSRPQILMTFQILIKILLQSINHLRFSFTKTSSTLQQKL